MNITSHFVFLKRWLSSLKLHPWVSWDTVEKVTAGLEMSQTNPGPHMKAVTLYRSGVESRERCVFIALTAGALITQPLEHVILVRWAKALLPRRLKGPSVFS